MRTGFSFPAGSRIQICHRLAAGKELGDRFRQNPLQKLENDEEKLAAPDMSMHNVRQNETSGIFLCKFCGRMTNLRAQGRTKYLRSIVRTLTKILNFMASCVSEVNSQPSSSWIMTSRNTASRCENGGGGLEIEAVTFPLEESHTIFG